MPAANATAFDVICEKCGAVYHTNEQHIGGYIECHNTGCDGRVPINRNNSSALEYTIEPTAVPQRAPTAAQQGILSNRVSRSLRLLSACFLFIVLALLLSKLFLIAAGHWPLRLPRRRLLHENINAGILIALGFAGASGIVASWGLYRGGFSHALTKRLLSAWVFVLRTKRTIQSMRLGLKVALALVACCLVAGVSFWVYYSTRPSPKVTNQPDDWELVGESSDSASDKRVSDSSVDSFAQDWNSKDSGNGRNKPDFSDVDSFMQQQRSEDAARRSAARRKTPTAELATADKRPITYNTQPSGTRITSDLGTDGHGKLKVSNGTSLDAVVRLYEASTDQTIRWFWVQSGGLAQISEIPQGTYALAYTTGLDWLESEDAFRWHPSYKEFGRQLRYTENRDSEGINYRDISVTLNSVVGGNVRTKSISREQFLKGHHHTVLQK